MPLFGRETEVAVPEPVNHLNRELSRLGIFPTAIPLAKLHMFVNHYHAHGGTMYDQYTPLTLSPLEGQVLEGFSRLEIDAMGSVLPPVGTEIEVPFHTLQRIDRRKDLATVAGYDRVYMDGMEHEFAAKPSYSWQVQADLVEELYQLTALSDEPGNEPMHFHINLQVPEGITKEDIDIQKEDAFIFATMAGLPFATPENLAIADQINMGAYWHKNAKALPGQNIHQTIFRFELRASRLTRATAAQNLEYAQKLGSCFFSYLKRQKGMQITQQEEELASLWEQSRDDYMAEFHDVYDYPLLSSQANILVWRDILANDDGTLTRNLRAFTAQTVQQIDSVLEAA